MAIGVPGWPEFAAWTASMARVRMVLMHFKSRDGETLMGPPRLRVRERLRVVPVLGRPVAYKPAAPRWQPKTLADQVCRQGRRSGLCHLRKARKLSKLSPTCRGHRADSTPGSHDFGKSR